MRKTAFYLALALNLWGCNPGPPPVAEETLSPQTLPVGTPATPVPDHHTPGVAVKTPPPTEAPAQTVVFGNDTYYLADSRSRAMGAPMKEFLLDGETFEDCTRLLAFRLSSGKDLSVYDKSFEAQMEKMHPDAEQKLIYKTPTAMARSLSWKETTEKGTLLEYDYWTWRTSPKGIASLQLIVRNRGELKDPAAFKKFVESHEGNWRKEADKLSKEMQAIVE